jgi:hypothetical protein
MTADRSDASRVVLHVGAPKSGTTFLQNAMWRNQAALRVSGYRCPGARQRDMFLAAIEVRGRASFWGLEPHEIEGTWRRLCAEAREFPGTTIMSHELLAAATDQQVAAARAELAGLDLHLVFTARDLDRQVVSEWQERVKNGSTQRFAGFARGISAGMRSGDFSGGFWSFHDLPGILARWGDGLPADHVHVVVAPRTGADPHELWRRFGAAVGFDAAGLDPTDPDHSTNPSLGVTEIAIMRQVNEALDGRIKQPAYAHVVKRFVSQGLLARHSSPRPTAPSELSAVLGEVAQRWIEVIGERGYQVHGDLADLLPGPPDPASPPADVVDPRAQADTSAAVIADLLVEVAQLRARVRRLQGRRDDRSLARKAVRWGRRRVHAVRRHAPRLR